MSRKICNVCNVEKDLSEFYVSSRHIMGVMNKCKECDRAYKRKRYKDNPQAIKATQERYFQRNPDAKRKALIKYTYGISFEDYRALFSKQDGCCAICGIPESELKRDLDIDHCHSTNRVRGLLCNNCNRGLGFFRDDIETIEKCLSYLKINQNVDSK